jgi:hypothetical protein
MLCGCTENIEPLCFCGIKLEEKICFDSDLKSIIEKINKILPSEVNVEIVDIPRDDGCEIIRIKKK